MMSALLDLDQMESPFGYGVAPVAPSQQYPPIGNIVDDGPDLVHLVEHDQDHHSYPVDTMYATHLRRR